MLEGDHNVMAMARKPRPRQNKYSFQGPLINKNKTLKYCNTLEYNLK